MRAFFGTSLIIALFMASEATTMTMPAQTVSEERMQSLVLDHMFHLSIGEGLLTRQHKLGQLEVVISRKNISRDHQPGS